jgi:hypothetical protein
LEYDKAYGVLGAISDEEFRILFQEGSINNDNLFNMDLEENKNSRINFPNDVQSPWQSKGSTFW